MAAARIDRRLAAIMAADVVGYSRLMERDEDRTLARLKAHRKEFLEPLIAEHHGRVVKLMGDGALVEFASVVDAVACAVAIQQGMAEREAAVPEDQRLRFRIGVNQGDIIHEADGDIYGDGVNIAARLEGLAEPGGICVSGKVREELRKRLELAFAPMGQQRVKNIAEPIDAWRVVLDGRAPVARKPILATRRLRLALAAALVFLVLVGAGGWWWYQAASPTAAAALAMPEGPSIAVLPLTVMDGGPEQSRLAGAITENIITDLARQPELLVIARNSTERYQGQAVSVRQVGRELGVRYVLEGSLQVAGDRVRVIAQLIEAESDRHVWAERYDRPLGDVFAVQDELSQAIVGQLVGWHGPLSSSIRQTARRQRPTDLKVYDLYLLGVESHHKFTPEGIEEAMSLLEQAVALDPTLARAWAQLAMTHLAQSAFGWSSDPAASMEKLVASAKQAGELDHADPFVLAVLAIAYAYENDLERSRLAFDRALAVAPNDADTLATVGWNRPTKLPTAAEDVTLVKKAMRLSPHYPALYLYSLGYAAYFARQYEEAIAAYKETGKEGADAHIYLALSYAQLGRKEDAAAERAALLKASPGFTAQDAMQADVFRDPEAIAHFVDGARKAGLPLCTADQSRLTPALRLPECEAGRAKAARS